MLGGVSWAVVKRQLPPYRRPTPNGSGGDRWRNPGLIFRVPSETHRYRPIGGSLPGLGAPTLPRPSVSAASNVLMPLSAQSAQILEAGVGEVGLRRTGCGHPPRAPAPWVPRCTCAHTSPPCCVTLLELLTPGKPAAPWPCSFELHCGPGACGSALSSQFMLWSSPCPPSPCTCHASRLSSTLLCVAAWGANL